MIRCRVLNGYKSTVFHHLGQFLVLEREMVKKLKFYADDRVSDLHLQPFNSWNSHLGTSDFGSNCVKPPDLNS